MCRLCFPPPASLISLPSSLPPVFWYLLSMVESNGIIIPCTAAGMGRTGNGGIEKKEHLRPDGGIIFYGSIKTRTELMVQVYPLACQRRDANQAPISPCRAHNSVTWKGTVCIGTPLGRLSFMTQLTGRLPSFPLVLAQQSLLIAIKRDK